MSNLDHYFDEIDIARIRRARELSELKRIFSSNSNSDPFGVQSKAVVVLSYAAWEGFYNECVETYHEFLKKKSTKISEIGWPLLVGALTSEFESLRARNHSLESKNDFVRNLKNCLDFKFDNFDLGTVQARSNLNFNRLSTNYRILGFNLTSLQEFRIRIDKEIVGWRHGVAHGSSPKLDTLDVEKHIDLVSKLLVFVADQFQEAILKHY